MLLGFTMSLAVVGGAHAVGSPNPSQSGSTGLQGTISSAPPTTPATINLPVNGQTVTSLPLTVSGACTTGLLVKVFSNNIFVGAVQCVNGSFSVQVDLFSGRNDLISRVYDALDQAGPDSNSVSVTYQDAQFSAFGARVSLTSLYAKKGADPGTQLVWPIILSGGTGPYAVSVDWGDGTAAELKSVPFAGSFDVSHVYKSAGVYRVVVKATDVNNQSAFLQIVGVANGKVTQGSTTGTSGGGTVVVKKVFVWWPFAVLFVLTLITFWLGKRYELQAIHRQIERQTSSYERELEQ